MFSAALGKDCTGDYIGTLEKPVYNEGCAVQKTVLRDHHCIVYLWGMYS